MEGIRQQISENVRSIHQVENTTFNNDVDVTNKCKLMKDCVTNANVRFSKNKDKTLIVGYSMLAGIEEKRLPGNRSVKFRIFPGATTHDMYDHLKSLHVGTTLSCMLEPIIR